MENLVMFNNTYRGKRVIVTGATGFKGSWLCSWLLDLGAKVYGYSVNLVSPVNLFEEACLAKRLTHEFGDVRDYENLERFVKHVQPDFIFHLAAQAIVSVSYEDPIDTISTNVIGTANILDIVKKMSKSVVAVIITSDKCYENVEQLWGYKETDILGGKDIYSASKGAAELIFSSYSRSFFKLESNQKIASARAGNVIGGGDWAKDRIVVDAMKSWNMCQTVGVRSPNATRPWQHVLEPLSGYLWLGACLAGAVTANPHGESFNFGPRPEKVQTVKQLIESLVAHWKNGEAAVALGNISSNFKEAGLLKLNIEKAITLLGWEPTLEFDECCKLVAEWYSDFYAKRETAENLVFRDISNYCISAKQRGNVWCQ
jgi:CDP-glucose 4,6-dehydratase